MRRARTPTSVSRGHRDTSNAVGLSQPKYRGGLSMAGRGLGRAQWDAGPFAADLAAFLGPFWARGSHGRLRGTRGCAPENHVSRRLASKSVT